MDRTVGDVAGMRPAHVPCEGVREELAKIEAIQEEIPKYLIDLHMCKELGELESNLIALLTPEQIQC